ncbi:sigma-70 family RNA polymerase sigma factor [Arachidicoccus sp.]|uniref:sigma-70 family RNA polymerase sigma factor n=1 Tax=Arachidicoccus sp. TaxID=1872624 RepID=UPI003D1E6F5F
MNPYQYLDESQLLAALHTDDAAKAFEVIYHKYWFNLYNWALKQTHSKEISEELVQIVFEKVWRNRQNTQIKNLGAYLAVSLKHTFYNDKRNQESAKKINNHNFPLLNNTTENDLNAKFLNESLESVLHELPDKTQTIFRLSRYESRSAHEIARNMEMSEKTVEYHISKALKILRIRLKEYLNIFL